MNALSTLSILPQTKTEISTFVERVKAELDMGEVNPLLFQQQLTAMKNVLDAISKDQDIRDIIMFEADKYVEKTIEINGTKITKKNVTRYSYADCNDSEWNELKAKADMANAALKGRETFLKSLKDIFVDTTTGETINPPLSKITEALSVTLPK